MRVQNTQETKAKGGASVLDGKPLLKEGWSQSVNHVWLARLLMLEEVGGAYWDGCHLSPYTFKGLPCQFRISYSFLTHVIVLL